MIPVESLRTYTVWDDGEIDERNYTVVEGREPPKFANGSPQLDRPELVFVIEAKDWNDAMRIYHKLQGWEPYVPMN